MERIFDICAPRTAPFGVVGWIFIGAILGGIPLIGLATVIATMGASDPGTTAIVALVFLTPIAILFALHRLFTKFRLSLLSDGTVEFVEPFKTTRIAKEALAGAHWRTTYVAASKRRMNWLILVDKSGTNLAAISPVSFSAEDLNGFVAALKKAHPGLQVTSG